MNDAEKAIHNAAVRQRDEEQLGVQGEPVHYELEAITDSSIREILEGAFPLVNTEVANSRMDICKGCPRLQLKSVCSLCKCFMQAKTKLENATCPEDKW